MGPPSTSPSLITAAIEWRGQRFAELGIVELQHIYMARQQVFCVEQQCAYLDVDGCDEVSFHVAAWTPAERMPLAYARLVDPGVKYAEPSIGRVLTTAPARGLGLGRELMRRMLAVAGQRFPGRGIRISAQSRLEAFYAGMGFECVGASYLEDGIPHTEMLRG